VRGYHYDRTHNEIDVLQDQGPTDAWTVSDHRSGDPEGVHVLHDPDEAHAHFHHLERHGGVEQLVMDTGSERQPPISRKSFSEAHTRDVFS